MNKNILMRVVGLFLVGGCGAEIVPTDADVPCRPEITMEAIPNAGPASFETPVLGYKAKSVPGCRGARIDQWGFSLSTGSFKNSEVSWTLVENGKTVHFGNDHSGQTMADATTELSEDPTFFAVTINTLGEEKRRFDGFNLDSFRVTMPNGFQYYIFNQDRIPLVTGNPYWVN